MNEFIISFDFRYALAGLTVVAILGVMIVILRNLKLQRLRAERNLTERIIGTVVVEKSLRENLIRLLHIYNQIVVDATSYGFYLYDQKSETFVLKSVIQSVREEENIEPSYSGLLPYNKEVYFMPSNIPEESMTESICIKNIGKVPLIHIPLKEIEGLVLIGPKSKIKKPMRKTLESINEGVQKIGKIMIWNENQGNRAVVAVSSDRALKNISRIFTDYTRMLERIANLTAKSIHASEGFFINRSQDHHAVEANISMKADLYEKIEMDADFHRTLYDLLGSNKSLLISQGKPAFYRLPPYLAADGAEAVILVAVDTIKGNGIAVFVYKQEPAFEEYQITALHILSEQMGELMDNQLKFKELSYAYNDMLKMLAQLVDNISPSTVGYSEKMWGYAIIIGKQLKLEPEKIRSIALAAYLSNIGVVGLSDDILSEKGKYTEIQYEMMKLHVEVGASIVETTLGDDEIASYIRYHHEREDGYGYPEGLKGVEIPIGAKIIGVIQTFLAKLQSREYRDGLPFDQALTQLKGMGGTQHDEEIIEALIQWFEEKRAQNINSGTSLGRCWEMHCCPEMICSDCPAYRNEEMNCWQNDENQCAAHGNTNCKSCFVYTEYSQRAMLK